MDTNTIQIQALVTFLTPLLIQLAKRSQARALAWIDQSKPLVAILSSLALACATSMGIQFAASPHSLTITWPDGESLARGLANFLAAVALQFAGQHVFYEGFWRHVVPSAH